MFHGRDVPQRHQVGVDAPLLARASLRNLRDLLLDAAHLPPGVGDDGVLADCGALQIGDSTRKLANRGVSGVRIALVAQRRLLLVKLLKLEEVELVGVRRFHASSPWVIRWLVHGSVTIVETSTRTSTRASAAAPRSRRARTGSHGDSVAQCEPHSRAGRPPSRCSEAG